MMNGKLSGGLVLFCRFFPCHFKERFRFSMKWEDCPKRKEKKGNFTSKKSLLPNLEGFFLLTTLK